MLCGLIRLELNRIASDDGSERNAKKVKFDRQACERNNIKHKITVINNVNFTSGSNSGVKGAQSSVQIHNELSYSCISHYHCYSLSLPLTLLIHSAPCVRSVHFQQSKYMMQLGIWIHFSTLYMISKIYREFAMPVSKLYSLYPTFDAKIIEYNDHWGSGCEHLVRHSRNKNDCMQ